MPEIQEIQEIVGKLAAVRARVAKAAEEGKATKDGVAVYDTSNIKIYGEGMSSMAIVEKIREDNVQMDDLQKEYETYKAAQSAFDELDKPVKNILHPTGEDQSGHDSRPQYKSFGQKITELPGIKERGGLKSLIKQSGGELHIPDVSIREFKTLFETTAGWEPESVRSAFVVPAVTRPIQLLDIIPMDIIDQAAAKYMEETTRTHAAAETAEGGAYNESTFVLTERTKTVEKITDSVPVTDEQLEDVSGANSYLAERIKFGIRQRLDLQMVQGDGSTPNFEGILNVSGIQTQAKGVDPVPDAIYKAMFEKVLLVGRSNPTHVLLHPLDWSPIRLLRTSDGIYIWGNPSEAGPERLWGLPVVQSDALDQNTGLVGSFEGAWIQLRERRGIVLELGFTGSQFVQGKQTIRASMRAVLVTYRPVAFCTVTGI